MKSRSGFTIVELLIVIVIIAILAAISLVAYNGVQLRSRNAQLASAVNAYKKALASYSAENGSYPMQADVCLGDGYPDLDNNGTAGDCASNSGTVSYSVNNAFDTALSKYLGQKPYVPAKPYSDGANRIQTGIQFRYITQYTLNGVSNPYWLIYKSEGIGPCPVGPIATESPTNTFVSTTPPNGYNYAWGSQSVQCSIPLPNPG